MDSVIRRIQPDGARYGAIAGIIIGTIPSIFFLEWFWNTPLYLEFPMTLCFIPCVIVPIFLLTLLVGCIPNLGIGVLIGRSVEKVHERAKEHLSQHQGRLSLLCGLVGIGIAFPIFLLLLFLSPLVELFWIIAVIVCAVFIWGLATAFISIFLSRTESNKGMWRINTNV